MNHYCENLLNISKVLVIPEYLGSILIYKLVSEKDEVIVSGKDSKKSLLVPV